MQIGLGHKIGMDKYKEDPELRARQEDEQLDAIRHEVMSVPMVGEKESPMSLVATYDESAKGFISGIEYVARKYKYYRRIRGDGNCFYRAFLFSYLEHVREMRQVDATAAQDELDRMIARVKQSHTDLLSVGYEESVIEIFLDMVKDLLMGLFSMTDEALLVAFQDGGESNYYIWYMRLVCACALKMNEERFLPFVTHGCDIDHFVKTEVEPMDKECDQVQIIALSEYLGAPLIIEYLDGRSTDAEGVCVQLGGTPTDPCSAPFYLFLLYRPGHYDVIYLDKQ